MKSKVKKIYFKHSIITSGNQDDVEKEINVFNDEDCQVLGVTVTPQQVRVDNIDGFPIPKYIYHVCITYQERNWFMKKTTESIAAATKVAKEILTVYGYNDPDKYPDYYGALEIVVDLLHLHQGDITKIPDQLRTY